VRANLLASHGQPSREIQQGRANLEDLHSASVIPEVVLPPQRLQKRLPPGYVHQELLGVTAEQGITPYASSYAA